MSTVSTVSTVKCAPGGVLLPCASMVQLQKSLIQPMVPNKFTKVVPTSCPVISISSAKVQCIVFATWIALLWSPINGSASMRASVRSGPCHYPHSTRSPTPRAGQGMPGLFTILYLSMGGSRGGKTAVHQSDCWIKKSHSRQNPTSRTELERKKH